MHAELERIYVSLEESRRRFLADLAALTPQQLRFRPRAGGWSLVEVAHHLLLAEAGAMGALAKRSGVRRRRTLRQRLLYPIVNLVLATGIKVKAPTRRVLPDPEIELDAVMEQWDRVRVELREILESIGDDELGNEAFKHPIAGPLDIREALGFFGSHLDHHLIQVRRIRSAAGFPATGAPAEAGSGS